MEPLGLSKEIKGQAASIPVPRQKLPLVLGLRDLGLGFRVSWALGICKCIGVVLRGFWFAKGSLETVRVV